MVNPNQSTAAISGMPLIALEEHFLYADTVTASQVDNVPYLDFSEDTIKRLKNLSTMRLRDMHHGGISLQVLSHVPVNPSFRVARTANDSLSAAIKTHQGRYAGIALIPMSNPLEAGAELTRCVRKLGFVGALLNDQVHGETYDSETYWPFFATAEHLGAPIYLHPSLPSTVTSQAQHYRGNYPAAVATALATDAWGWHSETGLHVLRLFAAGLFDRFPKLKLVLGHMGEMLPYSLERLAALTARWPDPPRRPLMEVWLNNVWVTTSGVFSLAPFACLRRVMPVERISYAVGYPFSDNEAGKRFLQELSNSGLVSEQELELICYKNAEKLFGFKVAK